MMGGDDDRIGTAEAVSTLAWWLQAGVDTAIAEAPHNWLRPKIAEPARPAETLPAAPAPDPVAEAPVTLAMPAPVDRLLMAARSAGVPVRRSYDAGGYLCNYLCWRAAEAAQAGRPRLATFIHVPPAHRPAAGLSRTPLTFDDLLRASEAIVRACAAAVH